MRKKLLAVVLVAAMPHVERIVLAPRRAARKTRQNQKEARK